MTMKKYWLSGAATALSATLAPLSASAQLDQITVTAQKKEESLQDAPLSVAAFNEEMLEAQGIRTLTDLSIQAPSLQFYEFPVSSSNIAIFLRGFGNTDSQTLTIDNPVGVYVDGVYLARTSGATLNILDLERVEILRGPQGTLFGRNSSAGAVSFITKRPSEEFSAVIRGGGGNFGRWNASATVDAPITDRFRVKGAYNIQNFDGWVENVGLNSTNGQPAEDFYRQDQQGFRVAATLDLTDNVEINYSYDWSEVKGSTLYYQQDPSKRQRATTNFLLGGAPFQYVLPESRTEQSGHNLTMTWRVAENFQIKSITGYRKMDELAFQNWSDTLFFATTVDWGTESISQEVQFSGSLFNDQMEFIAGYFYFNEDGDKIEEQFTNATSFALDARLEPLASTSILAGGNNLGAHTIDSELTSNAVFGQVSVTPDYFDSRLTITGGLRYTNDDREAVRGVDAANPSIQFFPGANSLEYSRLDYTGVVDYAWTDNISTYFRTATGYRAGGSGERTLDFSLTFDEETSTSYEIGLKSELFGRRLRVNAAAFMTDYDDLILTISGLPPDFASFVENVNAGEASINGIELDVIAAITDNATVTVNYALLDTELDGVIVPDNSFLLGGPPASPTNLQGADITNTTFLPFAPDHSLSAAFDYSYPLADGASIDFHTNFTWRDEVFSQPGLGLPVAPLGLWNARLSWSDAELGGATVTLSAWVRNLTNREEIVYDLSGFGFQFNAPRQWGFEVTAAF